MILSSGRVLFGAFELDLSTGELRSLDAPDPNNKVILREQVFQVLRMLLEREGKIVTRDEIKSRLWADDYGCRFRPKHQRDDQDPSPRLGGFRRQPSVYRDLGTAWLSIDAADTSTWSQRRESLWRKIWSGASSLQSRRARTRREFNGKCSLTGGRRRLSLSSVVILAGDGLHLLAALSTFTIAPEKSCSRCCRLRISPAIPTRSTLRTV